MAWTVKTKPSASIVRHSCRSAIRLIAAGRIVRVAAILGLALVLNLYSTAQKRRQQLIILPQVIQTFPDGSTALVDMQKVRGRWVLPGYDVGVPYSVTLQAMYK